MSTEKKRREKKKGFHIVAGDPGAKRSVNVIIDFLSCTRGKIIGGWVYCQVKFGPNDQVNDPFIDSIWPVVVQYFNIILSASS